ncbi:hypothetical protein [Vibrio mimicus]|uniref:hypothetical protein n=1 Tax=Vibrio mimicus TaxID=674 RepID=UPI0011D877FA|nr:hypothetical protein [Vibrio mimicus]TXX97341.1 hypothetical protein FXF05_19700 [Vibrio mimicus]
MSDLNSGVSTDAVERLVWTRAKAFCLCFTVVALSVKLYSTDIELKMDVPTFLSIVLALFSVGLSAIFYFKATDTSNKFYDNSYKYTKDVAQLLVKIESGFGERLKKLDEGYLSMKEEIQKIPSYSLHDREHREAEIENTKRDLVAEKEELEKINKEREEIISSLLEKSELQEDQKTEILKKLAQTENEAKDAQMQVMKLNKRLFAERMKHKEITSQNEELVERVTDFTINALLGLLPANEVVSWSFSEIRDAFSDCSVGFPEEYFHDLSQLGYFSKDHGLTKKGVLFIRRLAKQNL